MFNSQTLEVAIGMAFLFLSISLICTAVKEWLEGIFKWRALDLERGLRTLLDDADGSVTAELLRHPVLYSLFSGHYDPTRLRKSWLALGSASLHMGLAQRRNLPSYIPAGQFAVALLDCVARGPMPSGAATATVDATTSVTTSATTSATTTAPPALLNPAALTAASLRQSALNLASPHLQRAVLAALDHSDGDLAQVRRNLEAWFDGTMDRVSGWYKRRTQAVLFLLGLALAVGMNIDALYVMQRLSADKTFRETVLSEATRMAAADAVPAARAASAAPLARFDDARLALEKLSMPIGWRDWSVPIAGGAPGPLSLLPVPRQLCGLQEAAPCLRPQWWGSDWPIVLCGWLLTAFGVMLGAPFWFDVLNKIMVIRSTVKPHEKSREEASEDRQAPAEPTTTTK